ncbi:hypothetical protein Tdes44962_MAKER04837 [Teratosphaeria destructans]|uniref:Uncharacterized protein n=1 Tax=Teratosphaeria destructans TaxID=418781 RepID=A0A9W7SLI3_9PEZI|nr:hypothetical protein Tdes44962_MAKER04837 [Teratosphaeria destructans]
MLMMVDVARPVLAWVLVELLGPYPVGIAWILSVQVKSAFDMFASVLKHIGVKAKHQPEPDVDKLEQEEEAKRRTPAPPKETFEWPKVKPVEFRWPRAKPIDWKWTGPGGPWKRKNT